jgi:FlaA1/EpsC-like NDP-sugar epimerase
MQKARLRSLLVILYDLAAIALAWCGAYLLRFNLAIPSEYLGGLLILVAWATPLQAAVFRVFGLYEGIWRFASLPDLFRIVKAVAVSALLVGLVLLLFQPTPSVPRSAVMLQPLLVLFMMGGARVLYRAWKEHRLYGALQVLGRPVLVLGAGEAAVSLLRELSRSPEWRVVGLLDDNHKKQKRSLAGQQVLGGLDELEHWARELRVQHAIIAMPGANHTARRRAAAMCARAGVRTLIVPPLDDLLSGKVTVAKFRNVEVDDLLGREPVWIDNSLLSSALSGKAVMVTGAGGSIGAELCRQIAQFRPALLVAYEQNEYFLYKLQEEFTVSFPEVQVISVAGDIKDAVRVDQVMRQYAPTVVFHAAAYKHVPLMEDLNAWEAVRNNVLGTYTVARAAVAHGAEEFVLVSTDKAVNPTNVMGATKRLAEMICQAMMRASGSTRFEMVRFGNVLGSAGSVIPKFQEQIERGGPVTVTHPEITRYFMSIPEASRLVLQAACMGQGGEIFVMDMGEAVKIADLARDMIRLSGASEKEIRIEYTGLRPGEKLFEELLADDEETLPTRHPKLRIAKAREVEAGWLDEVLVWLRQPRVVPDAEVRRDLRRWIPEYQPTQRTELRAVTSASSPEGGVAAAI